MKDSKSKVLHDPIAYKERKTSMFGKMPTKEQATTGRFMPMGADYGVGHRTPEGSKGAKGLESGPIPFGCSAFNPNDSIRDGHNVPPKTWSSER